jgi:hypothetical protein
MAGFTRTETTELASANGEWGMTGRLRPQQRWLFRVEQRTLAGGTPDDALAPIAATQSNLAAADA